MEARVSALLRSSLGVLGQQYKNEGGSTREVQSLTFQGEN
jgi:hypothetical protein